MSWLCARPKGDGTKKEKQKTAKSRKGTTKGDCKMGSPTYRRRGRSLPCQACHLDALRMEEKRKKTQPCNKKNGPHIFLPKGVLNKGDGASTGHQRKISISI